MYDANRCMAILYQFFAPTIAHKGAFFLTVCSIFCLSRTCNCQQSSVPWLQKFANPGLSGMAPSKGLSFEWNNMPDFKIVSLPNGDISATPQQASTSEVENFRRMKLKVRAPLWNSDGLKAVIGFRYEHDKVEFEHDGMPVEGIHQFLDKSIRNIGADLTVLKPFRGKNYLVMRGSFNFSGEYANLREVDHRYLSYNFSTLLGTKKNEDTEWGAGLFLNNNLGWFSLYPVLLYNHNFNQRFGVEVLLPKRAALRYNWNENTILSAVVEGEGANYFIPCTKQNPSYHQDLRVSYMDLKAGLSLQKQIVSILWAGVDVGYRHNLNFTFENANGGRNDVVARSWIPGGMYANVSLFITPPRKFLNR